MKKLFVAGVFAVVITFFGAYFASGNRNDCLRRGLDNHKMIGGQRGFLAYDEIDEALPSEFFSPDELEDLMDVLSDM